MNRILEKYKTEVVPALIKEFGYKSIGEFKADKKVYHILNTNGNSYNQLLSVLKNENSFVVNKYSIRKKQYEIKISTYYDWEKLSKKGSNINEFFEIVMSFNT